MDTGQTANFLADLQATTEQVDKIITHLKNQERLSREDINFLEEVVFHLNALIVRLKNQKTPGLDLAYHDSLEFLTTANEHLRKVLVREENTTYVHSSPEKQKNNNYLFGTLIRQIQQLK